MKLTRIKPSGLSTKVHSAARMLYPYQFLGVAVLLTAESRSICEQTAVIDSDCSITSTSHTISISIAEARSAAPFSSKKHVKFVQGS